MERIDIVIPHIWTGVYINTARLLKYSIEDLGLKASICEFGEIQEGELFIVLGWHLIPDEINFKRPYTIYQLEPLILPLWQDKMEQKIKLFQNAKTIWGYVEANRIFFKPARISTGNRFTWLSF